VLKNLMIMLYPFVPTTMDRLREALRLPPEVFRLDELGKPIPAGHELGHNQKYFPGDARASAEADPPLSGPVSGPVV
jgi:methionyl-tRNA synthetase